MKKLLLLLGLVVSATAMAGVAEVRIGGDLTNRATFKDTDNSTWRINKDALKRGFEIKILKWVVELLINIIN